MSALVKANASDTSGLVRKTDYDAKICETKRKIPSFIVLVTTVAPNAIKNVILNVVDLVKEKNYYDANYQILRVDS